MVILQNISYSHLNKDVLFTNISLTINAHEKVAITGNNGAGKSTLLKIISGELQPLSGHLDVGATLYTVPQVFGQYDHLTVRQALKVDDKLVALSEILNGNATETNFELLDNDWGVEERCAESLQYWDLTGVDMFQSMSTLSGGQKTRVFLAGILIHQPQLVLMDEPSNHLDAAGRELLYEYIRSAKITLIAVSHDRKLLGLFGRVCELSSKGIKSYGGNYDFYVQQKAIEQNALSQDIQSKEKALRKAREKERETIIRQQKLDARGKGKQEKAGVARIMMNTLKNNAEATSSKLRDVHAEKIDGISKDLQGLRAEVNDPAKMKFGFRDSAAHNGKVLVKLQGVNYNYGATTIWKHPLTLEITAGERIALKGANGSGKTTLIQLITGNLQSTEGTVHNAGIHTLYIDQDYSLINNSLSIYDQAMQFNDSGLEEHDIKIRLNRFLFTREHWDKPCSALSGGERLKLLLCCLTIISTPPHIIILDEPTNNLDISNIEMLTAAAKEYKGALIVVSHDETFLNEIGVGRIILL